MSYSAEVALTVEAAIARGMTISDVTTPLIDQIARAVVLGLRNNTEPRLRREARDGMVEILRHDLDQAVAKYSSQEQL